MIKTTVGIYWRINWKNSLLLDLWFWPKGHCNSYKDCEGLGGHTTQNSGFTFVLHCRNLAMLLWNLKVKWQPYKRCWWVINVSALGESGSHTKCANTCADQCLCTGWNSQTHFQASRASRGSGICSTEMIAEEIKRSLNLAATVGRMLISNVVHRDLKGHLLKKEFIQLDAFPPSPGIC